MDETPQTTRETFVQEVECHCKAFGIRFNVPDVGALPVAEHTDSVEILNHSKHICEFLVITSSRLIH